MTTTPRLNADDIPIVAALNFTAMTCLTAGAHGDVEAIVAGTLDEFGRLLPTLICQYASRVVARNLDAARAEAELAAVFTPDELAEPVVRLIRLSLIVTQGPKIPGYETALGQAHAELQALADDERQEPHVRQRAASLLGTMPVAEAA